MYDEDEFSYPQRVQDALDFVEQATAEERRKERDRYRRGQNWRRGAQDEQQQQQQREADSDAKFWETRRAQQAAQQAKKRFRPAQPDGWVKP
jgi:hypothetical protein